MVTTIADVRVDAAAFPLGRIFQEYPDIEIDLERLVPMREAVIPLFWVRTGKERAVEETLRTDPNVEDVRVLTTTPEQVLYSVRWGPEIDGLVQTLIDPHIDVLAATGSADAWDFRLQFRSRVDLKRFRDTCRRQQLDIHLLELFNPMMPLEKGPLTSQQKDVLATAFENGYWDIPRSVTQADLADLIGVPDSSFSRLLRTGESLAVSNLLYGPGGNPFEPQSTRNPTSR